MKEYQRIQEKIITGEKLREKKISGKMIFTNGCFDIIHYGHVNYLSKAAELGDYLVVGLNSDHSVRQLKGQNRPIQDEKSRASILASFFFVDYVIIFNEETPYELIKLLQPEILVKGGDYKAEEIVGHDIISSWGGEVKIIDFVKGYSSTSILNKFT
ncbi:MAG: D-glycero-beta-D-manno-heptose 1-phosphate adenylyltransferase [Bacteroidota bacterium]